MGKLEQICPTSGIGPLFTGGAVTTKVHVLTRFAARVQHGHYGRGKRVTTGTVVGALTAVRQEIALAYGTNPTKIMGSYKLLPWLSQIYDGWRKEDPPTTKQLPVEADVPKLLATRGRDGNASELERAIGDLSLIAFYYLLRIGKYTIKGKRKETKQTVQFKYKDVTFFKKNSAGNLRCLPRTAPAHLIATADGATMKLENQKKRLERGVRVPRSKRGRLPMSSQSTRTTFPPHTAAWRYGKDFPVRVLGKGHTSRRHG